jgi:glycosyltransferase involved in cell wall biosynthesis
LFVSYDGLTDPLGQSQVIPYLAGLTRFGFRFTILSFDKPEAFTKNAGTVKNILQQYPIKWVSVPYHKNPPVLSSVYDYQLMKKKMREIYREDPFLMIHTRPGLPELAAANLKKRLSVLFFHDVRGFWADERVDGGMWNRKNPLFNAVYRYFKSNERKALINADAINCLTRAARREMLTWPYLKGREISVVSCAADLDLFDPSRYPREIRTKARTALGFAEDDLIFSYLGSIGGWYLTAEMMRLCKKISDKIPKAKFLFISPHRHEVILDAAAESQLPPEIIKTVHAGREEVPGLLAISDMALFFIKPCYSKISSSPTKHGEIMAMGLPVITNTGVGDVAEIVRNTNSGILLENFSDESLDKAVNEILNRKFNPEEIRRGAFAYYSLEKAVQTYREAYDKLLS